MLLVAWVLGPTHVVGPSSLILGDVFLGGAIVLFFATGSHQRIAVPSEFGWLLALLSVAVLSTLWNFRSIDYSFAESSQFFAKMSFYCVGLIVVFNALIAINNSYLAKAIRWVSVLNLLVAISQQVGHRAGGTHRFFRAYGAGEWDRSSWPRSRGLFSEPSTLAIFVVITCYWLAQTGRLSRKDLLAAAGALTLAASFIGIGFAVLATAAFLWNSEQVRVSRVAAALALVTIATAVPVAILAEPVRKVLDERVFSRVTDTLQQAGDPSGSGRIFDSWSAAHAVGDGWTLLGVGPGNFSTHLDLQPDLDIHWAIYVAGGGWNIFGNVTAELGVIGAVTLFAMLVSWTRFDRRALVMIVGLAFATGTFVGWAWWMSCALLALTHPSISRTSERPTISTPTPDYAKVP